MIHTGDCLDVMPTLDAESIDAIVTDPPYGLEFMGKAWDRLGDIGKSKNRGMSNGRFKGLRVPESYNADVNLKCRTCRKWRKDHAERRCVCEHPDFPNVRAQQGSVMQAWHEAWAREALRVAKPSAYLLAFGGTRTVHRLACAIEDAGWIIRDTLVWAYASGFPKSRASLKPAWEPIVMARKPGPLRMLAIDACRIGYVSEADRLDTAGRNATRDRTRPVGAATFDIARPGGDVTNPSGRWPSNVILTSPIFDGDVPGVVGGGEAASGGNINGRPVTGYSKGWADERWFDGYGDSGTYSRFFLIPKADRADREPVLGGLPLRDASEALGATARLSDPRMDREQERRSRANVHPTVKPTELMRHLVRLVTPPGGVVLDPFLGSGTTALACEAEGFAWIGIEREPEYVAIAEARLNGTQRGMGLVG